MGRIIGSTESSSFLTLNSTYAEKIATAQPLSKYAVGGVAANLNLDFKEGQYRLGKIGSTFADAFTGTSPKLTYSTTSHSTMVNSAGNIVWAPHNLHSHSSDVASWASVANVTASSSSGNELGDIPTTLFTATGGSAQHRAFDVQLTNTGHPVTFSFYIKPGTFDYVQFHDGVTVTYWADFDLTGNGSVIRHTGFDATPTIEAVTSAGQTFFKVTVQYTAASAASGVLPIISFPDPSTVVSPGTRNPTWTAAGTETLYIGGIHLYRSDLGGMAQVPGAATGFETYVPTNSSAEYLPRVGHHVYNGSTWVNEGLLIESEARTNLFLSSNDFTTWAENTTSGATTGLRYIQENAAIGPDGQTSAHKLVESTDLDQQRIYYAFNGMTANTDYTYSVFLKAGERTEAYVRTTSTNGMLVDLSDGTFTVISGSNHDVQPMGNGWYRCSFTVNEAGTQVVPWVTIANGGVDNYTGDGTSGIYVYGAQFELGSTPSSYMPTNGGTYTRTAQSLTVPPAEFGWPEPEYIGPELVTNGTFDTDTSGWTAVQGTISVVSGMKRLTNSGTSFGYSYQAFATTVGAVYEVSGDIKMGTASDAYLRVGTTPTGFDLYNSGAVSTDETKTALFVATSTTTYVHVLNSNDADAYTDFDNISVREINPLSVSIQMDGRMTYADNNSTTELEPWRWYEDINNYIQMAIRTDGTFSGGPNFGQKKDTSTFISNASLDPYSPGINVPFNIAGRHGSTFINGAADGVALTASTAPTALPDLSNTNLQIAYDFMGTIGQFRQFAGDIGDAGLETSSDPGPSLSLTFDGSATSSFVIN